MFAMTRQIGRAIASRLSGTGLLAELQEARTEAANNDGLLDKLALAAFESVRQKSLIAARSSGGSCSQVRTTIEYPGHRGDNHYARQAVARRLQELLRKEGINATIDNAYEYVSFSF